MIPTVRLSAGTLLAVSVALIRADTIRFRVYNGRNDTEQKYPFIVAIYNQIKPNFPMRWCTGSMITPEWVLTNAHSLRDTLSFVQYGNMSIKPRETLSRSPIIRMIPHPTYRRVHALWRNDPKLDNDRSNDIALLRIRPVNINEYGKLSGVHFTTLVGTAVKYAGYGKLDYRPTLWAIHNTQPLQIGEGTLGHCPKDRKMARCFICVYAKCNGKGVQTPLRGDYGAPLFYDDKIIGVMKAVVITEHIITRTTWTPISLHLTWLHRVIATGNSSFFDIGV